jgi:hypothetical protein
MMAKLNQGFLLFSQNTPYSKVRVSWYKKGVKAKSMAYIGAWGVLWPEKVENWLKLHFKNVNKRLGTITQWVKRFKHTFRYFPNVRELQFFKKMSLTECSFYPFSTVDNINFT